MLLRLLLMTMITTTSLFAQTMPPLETGVSQTLAKWRGANYSDVRYKLNITLEKGAPLMKGEIEISVKLTDEGAKNDLILDWRTTQFANDKDKPFANVIEVNEAKAIGTVSGEQTSLPKSVANDKSASNSQDNRRSISFSRYSLITEETLALQSNEHLIIPHRFLKTGENIIKINFASPIKTSGAAITRYIDKEDGAEYIYSLFVPSDASTAFPVFDQPDLKARFQLSVEMPEGWKVISNTNIKSESKNNWIVRGQGSTISSKSDYREFEETKPISTYVFAFAAGDFAEFEDESEIDKSDKKERAKLTEKGKIVDPSFSKILEKSSTVQSKIYVRKSQAEKFKQHAAEVFRLNREGVKFLESYFDYKFPFPKYDLVLIPEFPFGGMEHAGATFLREDRVIFPTEPTKNDYITRANVIFHEAAHQWFGDTVTMKWFDDLWLKEGFAEFMAYKTLEKVMPEYNAWKIFYERNKQSAYLTDSTRGTTPIYQEIPNLSAAKSAYGNIVYRKAPSFLRQAEFYLGEDKFQIAVRAFLKKHEFANAEWTDLVKEFEDVAWASEDKGFYSSLPPEKKKEYELGKKQEIKDWAANWVNKRGLPLITVRHLSEELDAYSIEQRNILNEKGSWKNTFNVLAAFEDGSRKKYRKQLELDYETAMMPIARLESKKSLFLFPNYQDYGYGIFLLDEKSRAYVLANIQTEKDDFLRTMMWGALWDSVREGELNPKDYVELVIKNINVESDESTIQTLLGRVSTAMNYYLPDKQRDELAPQVEAIAFGGMTSAKTSGLRITFFRTYLNVASTENARVWLRKILESDGKPIEQSFLPGAVIMRQKLPPLTMPPLKTKDKFDIVTKLLILENRRRILGKFDSEELLAELEKTETSDEAKRYAYAAKAGIGKANNKAKYWNDFTNDKDLSESYIESAFVVFNTPPHSDLTLPYLEKALAELPNLKKNRKIFFVNGWLSAFIGGQKSEQALAIVNKFLADNPNLDKDLRLKILENADGLERAVKIRAKYGK